jgi:hypothetical protein
MRITLLAVDTHRPQPARGGQAVGYPCRFRSEWGAGEALFVPAGPAAETAGRELDARLEFEGISGPQPQEPGEEPAYRLEPLSTPGDYRLTGVVLSILWLDDEGELALLEARVGDEVLSLPLNGAAEDGLEYGAWASFTLHGLTWVEQRGTGTHSRD